MAERYNNMLQLFRGVPLRLGLPHQIEFESQSAQYDYFASFTDVKRFEYISIVAQRDNYIEIKVEGDILDLGEYTYGWFNNLDLNSRRMYFFVLRTDYINSRVCMIRAVIDSFQSYQFAIVPSYTYVQRCSPGVSSVNENIQKLLRWVEEDIDTGKDYVLADHAKQDYILAKDNSDCVVLIYSSCDLTKNNGTASAPRIAGARGCITDGVYSAQDVYVITDMSLRIFDTLSDYPWVTQNFSKIIMFPKSLINMDDVENVTLWSGSSVSLRRMKYIYTSPKYITGEFTTDFDPFPKYPKLRGLPFCYGELTDLNGNVLTFDLRGFEEGKLIYRIDTAMSFNPEVRFTVTNYLNNFTSVADTFNNMLTDYSISISNWVEISTLLDGYTLALANSEYTRNASIQNMYQSTELQQWNNKANTAMGGVNALGTLLSGNVGGALTGAINTGANYFIEAHNISEQTEMQKRTLTAQTSQMKTTPPSLVGGFAQNTFLLSEGLFGWHFRIRACRDEYYDKAIEFFKNSGVSLNSYMRLDIHENTQTLANYWHTVGFNVRGNMPKYAQEDIEALFNTGVNIWHETMDRSYDLSTNNPV